MKKFTFSAIITFLSLLCLSIGTIDFHYARAFGLMGWGLLGFALGNATYNAINR